MKYSSAQRVVPTASYIKAHCKIDCFVCLTSANVSCRRSTVDEMNESLLMAKLAKAVAWLARKQFLYQLSGLWRWEMGVNRLQELSLLLPTQVKGMSVKIRIDL